MRKATARYQERPRSIYIPETVADLYAFSTKHIRDAIVFDVETNRSGRITEFSIATSATECLYVILEDRAHVSQWSEQDELDIWLWLSFLARRKDLAWGFHNATYDLTYLDAYGIRPQGPIFDTMLRHHAYQPELEKSLGFLAALYVPTRAWKHLRTKAKKDFNKRGAL
jgi:DNA polymerase I-like protein with 3'-5' exonuclease and polymerase domains